MEESLIVAMERVADMLHWLGKYREGNAICLLVRLLRTYEFTTLDDLEAYIDAQDGPADAAEVEG